MPTVAKQTVEPATTTVDTAPTLVGGCEQYRPLLDKYDWDSHIAYAIMRAENTACDPTKDNAGLNSDGTNDVGLMQINSIHVTSGLITESGRRDPEQNIRAAYSIYLGSGWNAWSTYKNGSYLKYM